ARDAGEQFAAEAGGQGALKGREVNKKGRVRPGKHPPLKRAPRVGRASGPRLSRRDPVALRPGSAHPHRHHPDGRGQRGGGSLLRRCGGPGEETPPARPPRRPPRAAVGHLSPPAAAPPPPPRRAAPPPPRPRPTPRPARAP